MRLSDVIKLLMLLISVQLCGISAQNDCIKLSETQLESVLKRILNESPKVVTNTTTADELQLDKEQIKIIPSEPRSPLNINITFYIEDINSISDVHMDYRVDYYSSQEWSAAEEECKSYSESLSDRMMYLNTTNTTNRLILNKDYYALFWMPDIMLANSKEVKQQSELIETTLLEVYLDQNRVKCHLKYIARFSAIVACPMDFHDAPVDTQYCYIQLRSFAFTEDKIQLNWANNVTYNKDLRLHEHKFEISQKSGYFVLFEGIYSILSIRIKFERKLANKLVGVYTPSILIVLITFCSFWLGLNSTPERVTIGITAVLALVTQFSDVRQSLPSTSYITEIDKWMIICMLFVSAQLFQCTLVHYVYERQKHNNKLKHRTQNVINHFKRGSRKTDGNQNQIMETKINPKSNIKKVTKLSLNENQNNSHIIDCCAAITSFLSRLISVPLTPEYPEYLPMRIDAVSQILFPLLFSIICMFYWPTMIFKSF